MSNCDRPKTDWHAVGFSEGAEAGMAEMVVREADFKPEEGDLAFGHAMLDGCYSTIRRRQMDFQAFEDVQDWTNGVLEGVGSVSARIGYMVTINYPHAEPDGGAVTYILVTRDFGAELGSTH